MVQLTLQPQFLLDFFVDSEHHRLQRTSYPSKQHFGKMYLSRWGVLTKCIHKSVLEKIIHFQFIFSKLKNSQKRALRWTSFNFAFTFLRKVKQIYTFLNLCGFLSKAEWWKKWTKLSIFFKNHQRKKLFFTIFFEPSYIHFVIHFWKIVREKMNLLATNYQPNHPF